MKSKSLVKGLEQLSEEGAAQYSDQLKVLTTYLEHLATCSLMSFDHVLKLNTKYAIF